MGDVMDTIDKLYKKMDDGDFTQEEEYSIQNDGIGSYEYCGYKGFDAGVNYVEGTVILTFELDSYDEELLKEFCELETEIQEVCEFHGEDPEIQDIDYNILKDKNKVEILVFYTAIPYRD